MRSKTIKNSPYALIAIPVLLLIVSVFLLKKESPSISLNKDFNSYLQPLPNDYAHVLNSVKANDSLFFISFLAFNSFFLSSLALIFS